MYSGEFYVIVEYCRFGNLRTYLKDNRDKFINLLDAYGNLKTISDSQLTSRYLSAVYSKILQLD